MFNIYGTSFMRIKITFTNPNKITYLPINANYYLVGLINHLIYEYRRYLNSLIPGNKRQRKIFDMYTFSQLIIPNREVIDFQIGIRSSEFYWFISSPYYQFLGLLAKELRERNFVRIYDTWFGLEKVEYICSPEFKNAEAQFTCLSPVAVYRQQFCNLCYYPNQFQKGYILPDESEYISFLERDLLYKYNLVQNKKLNRINFDFEFDHNYLRRRNNKITKIITLENDAEISDQVRGVLAPIHIKAEPEVLRFIYDAGLGQLNNLGFGMVETVAEGPIRTN